MTDRTDWEHDPSDYTPDPPEAYDDAERLQRLEESGFYDAADGYAHLDELRPFDERDPW